jgi:hypothetical protein
MTSRERTAVGAEALTRKFTWPSHDSSNLRGERNERRSTNRETESQESRAKQHDGGHFGYDESRGRGQADSP